MIIHQIHILLDTFGHHAAHLPPRGFGKRDVFFLLGGIVETCGCFYCVAVWDIVQDYGSGCCAFEISDTE